MPQAGNNITFELSCSDEIVATDNGDPTDLKSFSWKERKAFNGLAIVIVRAKGGSPGSITITAKSQGLLPASAVITSR